MKSKVEQLNRLKKSVSSLSAKNGNGKASGVWFPSLPSPDEMSPNPKLPNLSDSVTVRYEEGRGRYCVAKKDISAGHKDNTSLVYVCTN